MNAAELEIKLDSQNARLRKLLARDLRSGRGPSQEMKEAHKASLRTWYLWSHALDIEAGRKPCFPFEELSRLQPAPGGAK